MEAVYLEAEDKKMKRRIIFILVTILLSILALELLLSIFDPLGIMRYIDDLQRLERAYAPDRVANYAFIPGRHDFAAWALTANTDNTRWIPDSNNEAALTIALVGDSVTSGMGVDDYDTWVNLLAREFPDIAFINAGVPGYTSHDVLRSMAKFDADIYIYYIVGNDDAIPRNGVFYSQARYSAIYQYLHYGSWRDYATDLKRFDADIATLAGRGVYFVGHDDLFNRAAGLYPDQSFEASKWSSPISWADNHADVKGNQGVAKQMIRIVKKIIGG